MLSVTGAVRAPSLLSSSWPRRSRLACPGSRILHAAVHDSELNHLRMENHGTPDLRDEAALSRLGGPFERTAHLVDVRRIAGGAGRYNIPNIGVHVWRLSANELHRATAHQVDADNRLHYTFSQLGQDVQLFRRPQDMPRAFDSATERNVPDAIRRRVLDEQFDDLYGEQSSVAVWDGEDFIEPEQVAVVISRVGCTRCQPTGQSPLIRCWGGSRLPMSLQQKSEFDITTVSAQTLAAGPMTDPHRLVDSELRHCVSGQIPYRRFPKGSSDSPRLEKRWPTGAPCRRKSGRCH